MAFKLTGYMYDDVRIVWKLDFLSFFKRRLYIYVKWKIYFESIKVENF